MDFKELFKSKNFKGVLMGVGVVFVVLIVFQTGVIVGSHKSNYSNRLGEKYFNAFGKEEKRGMPNFMRDDFAGAHGTAGRIVKIELPQLLIEDQEGIEKTILITQQTEVMAFRQKIKAGDLKIDQNVVVVGTPNDQAQIEAKIIRLMPPFPGTQNFVPAVPVLPASPSSTPTPISTAPSDTNY